MAQQRMTALAKGNATRIERAQIKRECKTGRRSAAATIRELPECMETMCALDALTMTPRWGAIRAARLLKELHIGERRRMASLSPRQRNQLADLVEGAQPLATAA